MKPTDLNVVEPKFKVGNSIRIDRKKTYQYAEDLEVGTLCEDYTNIPHIVIDITRKLEGFDEEFEDEYVPNKYFVNLSTGAIRDSDDRMLVLDVGDKTILTVPEPITDE